MKSPPDTGDSEFWDNFRDLGGMPVRGGGRTRAGLLFRSGHWAKLTAADQRMLVALGLVRIFDFRTEHETQRLPSLLPPGIVSEHLPIEGGTMPMTAIDDALIAGEPQRIDPDYLIGANRSFVREYAPVLRRFMHALLEGQPAPQLIHCTAGKDRTGLAAALVLATLRVEPDAIWADYLKSNEARVRINRRLLGEMRANTAARIGQARADALDMTPVLNLLTVKRAYLQAAFDAIDEDHGSFDAFLAGALDIGDAERRELRRRFLE